MIYRPREQLRLLILMLTLILPVACQSGGPQNELNLTVNQKPYKLMVTIADNIQKCWFRNGNASYRKFRMANELNSYAGKPRILLVPRNNPAGLPSLVVQAQTINGATKLHAFGPLLATNVGKKSSADLKKWTSGKTACAI